MFGERTELPGGYYIEPSGIEENDMTIFSPDASPAGPYWCGPNSLERAKAFAAAMNARPAMNGLRSCLSPLQQAHAATELASKAVEVCKVKEKDIPDTEMSLSLAFGDILAQYATPQAPATPKTVSAHSSTGLERGDSTSEAAGSSPAGQSILDGLLKEQGSVEFVEAYDAVAAMIAAHRIAHQKAAAPTDYYPGKGCTCFAKSSGECGCEGVDWRSTREVELEAKLAAPVGRSAEVNAALEQVRQASRHTDWVSSQSHRLLVNYITSLEAQPKAPATAVECAAKAREWLFVNSGLPVEKCFEAQDYLAPIIGQAVVQATTEAREKALEEAAQLVKELSHQNGDTIEVIRIRALKG